MEQGTGSQEANDEQPDAEVEACARGAAGEASEISEARLASQVHRKLGNIGDYIGEYCRILRGIPALLGGFMSRGSILDPNIL